jgi:CheY-like chemotaxis protein
MNILLVEDNPGDILLAQEALNELAVTHHLQVVRDGEGAICIISELMETPSHTPDLILLDLNLPGLSGLEVLSFIKSYAGWNHVPVVVFSTSDAETDISSCYQRRANCFITKPIGFEELVQLFRQILSFWGRQTYAFKASA